MRVLLLIDQQGNGMPLYSSKTKPDTMGSTKMHLRAKFTKPASLNIKIPVAPIPTTKPLSSLLKSHKFGQQIPGTLKTWYKIMKD